MERYEITIGVRLEPQYNPDVLVLVAGTYGIGTSVRKGVAHVIYVAHVICVDTTQVKTNQAVDGIRFPETHRLLVDFRFMPMPAVCLRAGHHRHDPWHCN